MGPMNYLLKNLQRVLRCQTVKITILYEPNLPSYDTLNFSKISTLSGTKVRLS